MRKLFLTSFTGKSEDGNVFEEIRIVAPSVNKDDDDRTNILAANKLVGKWFKEEYPNCTLDSIYTRETISEDYFKPKPVDESQLTEQSENIIDGGKRFYSINDHEGLEEVIVDGESEGYTKDVLIDLHGDKKHFRVGWLHIDDTTQKKTWCLHDGVAESQIDMKHAVYTKLDF